MQELDQVSLQASDKSVIRVSKYKAPKLKSNSQNANQQHKQQLHTQQNDISLLSKRQLSISDFQLESTEQFPTGLLGKGTFGEVMLMKNLECNQVFAIKILGKKGLFQHNLIKNLKEEIRIQKQLESENIVKLYNYFEDHENVYLILEFCKYGNLQEYLRQCRHQLLEKEIYQLFVQVCRGIECLHSNGIVHRDLKPENILIDYNFTLKVSDFGFSTENSVLKQSFVGTMAYMSPEMLSMGDKAYTSKIDIWGLGIILFQLIYGEKLFFAQSQNIQNGNLPQSFPYSSDLFHLLTSLLKISPEQRATLPEIFQSTWIKRMSGKGVVQNIQNQFQSEKKRKENKENQKIWDQVLSILGCGAPRKRS